MSKISFGAHRRVISILRFHKRLCWCFLLGSFIFSLTLLVSYFNHDDLNRAYLIETIVSDEQYQRKSEVVSELQKSWQKVDHADDEMYVYSAFHDENLRKVRVIAVVNRLFFYSLKLECRFAYHDSTPVKGNTKAEMNILRDHLDHLYGAAFVLCPFSNSHMLSGDLPTFVSIVAQSNSDVASISSNILRIQYPSPTPSVKFAICVSPTYSYDQAIRFLEWIEFQRSLGVERFTFYNTSIGPSVSCIINEYSNIFQRLNRSKFHIEVLPWGDPSRKIVSDVSVKLQNQLAATNDCIYRHRGVAEYVINIDLDEFIIPHKEEDRSLEDMIRRLEGLPAEKPTVLYKFRNAFFSSDYQAFGENASEAQAPEGYPQMNDLTQKIIPHLVTSRVSVRMKEPNSYGMRTKYICMPRRIVEAGIHSVSEYVEGYEDFKVTPDVGLLHHYRAAYEREDETVQDKAAYNLSVKYNITNKVYKAIKAFRGTCNFQL